MIDVLNKRVDLYLQENYQAQGLLLEGREYDRLLLRVGQEFIKLKEVCRDADFYIEEAIAVAIEEIKKDESGISRNNYR